MKQQQKEKRHKNKETNINRKERRTKRCDKSHNKHNIVFYKVLNFKAFLLSWSLK